MQRVFICLLLLLIGSSAWAAGSEPNELFYVRTFAECPAFNGDGTAYTCAASNGGVGAKRGFSSLGGTATPDTEVLGTIDKGDTVYLCGHFVSADRGFSGAMFNASTHLQGVSGSPVVIEGDCSDEGNLAEAIIDGEGVEALGIQVWGAYTTWQHFTLKNVSTGMSSSFAAEPAGVTIQYVTITDIGFAQEDGQVCLEGNFATYLFDNLTIGPCGSDGIYVGNGSTGVHQGTISNSTITDVSNHIGNGDGIQMEPGGGGIYVYDVTITKRGTDKACMLLGGANGATIVRDVDCSAVTGYGQFGCLTIDGAATGSSIRGLRCHDIPGGVGIYIRADNLAVLGTLDVYGNVVSDMGSCLAVSGVHAAAVIRFYNNTCDGMTLYGISASNTWNPGTFTIRNNLIESAGYQIYLGPTPAEAAGDWNSNYNFFKGTGTYFYLTVNHTTLAAYASASGDEANSQNVDPLVSPNGGTMGNSTARRAGSAWADCRDFRGRPCWAPPDIGAYQSTSGDPAATRAVRN